MELSETPIELIEEVSKQISHYLIGIVKIQKSLTSEDAILIGSGTLVEIENTFGILTAHHVMERLPPQGKIGFVLFEQLHRYTLQSEFLEKIVVDKELIPSEGPDLAFIVLPPTTLGQIKALKSFYNLSLKRDKILSNPFKNDMGIWFLCGFPDEQTTYDRPIKGFEIVKGFHGLCGAGGVEKEYIVGNYDYLEFEVHYNKNSQVPKSFGGVSGGGLWHVPLQKSKEGKITPQEIILSGVAFHQSSMINNIRTIKCHGRRSIYKVAYELVRNKCF